jgi:PKD repeat protein
MKNLPKKIIAITLINLITLSGFSQLNNAFRFKITGNGYSDETIIRMLNGASVNFDGSFDAWKLFSLNPNVPSLYTQISPGQELSINALPDFTKDTSIIIYTRIPANGNYTLDIEELFPLTSNYKVSLTNLNSNTHYRILGDTSLVLSLDTHQHSPTLMFNISTLASSSTMDETCFGMNDGSLTINNLGNTNWDISILDSNNNILVNSTSNSSVNNFNNLNPGDYSAEITSKGIIDKINFSISAGVNLIADFTLDTDTAYLSNGGNINLTNNSQYAQNYTWDFDDGITSSSINPSHTYTTIGIYDITLLAQNTNCLTQKTKQITILSSPVVITSINDVSKNKLKVINNGNGNYQLSTTLHSQKTIKVYDIMGKSILEDLYTKDNYNLSLTNNSSGIYIIKIRGENGFIFQEKIYR